MTVSAKGRDASRKHGQALAVGGLKHEFSPVPVAAAADQCERTTIDGDGRRAAAPIAA
jgi:hypothetical protein